MKAVKIVALKPGLILPLNGGEISLLENLSELKARGHEVRAFATFESTAQKSLNEWVEAVGGRMTPSGYQLDALNIDTVALEKGHPHELMDQENFESAFRQILESERADEVWVHYTDFFAVSAAVGWSGQRTWVRQTDAEYPKTEELKQFPSLSPRYEAIEQFQVASRFMERFVAKDFRTKIRVLPNWMPALDRDFLNHPHGERSEWLFVNPTPVKGIRFIEELAKALPEEKFLIVGNWNNEEAILPLPNMAFVPREKNCDRFFKRAKALLMPSEWQEAFGRLPLEAMAAEVPVISSNRGALPETIGQAGQILSLEIPQWIEAMRRTSQEGSAWIKKGKDRVREYREGAEKQWTSLFGPRKVSL